ncbi:MAG TPA: N-formylglutamate amidohydrolase [Feifaniaceae bacterium]|nr:N-formylglutamate amidohydrolase [Feifaniaceae bacterium]
METGHVVLHIPHGSVLIPPEDRKGILLNDAELFHELCVKTDAFTGELFLDAEFPVRVVAPVSRLVCDVERFRDDKNEPGAKRGEGAVYIRTYGGKPLRAYNADERERILRAYYDPHHRRLAEAVETALKRYGRCTIVDCHSFHSKRPIRLKCLFKRPDICIGTDSFHTPGSLRDTMLEAARKEGMYARTNTPYSGSITPIAHYRRDGRVKSVMVEVNRRLYMDELTMQKNGGFERMREVCRALLRAAAMWEEAPHRK